ncbi:MAG: hypothetical protein Q8S00_32555 [Deltaproteobacteria bacterium]|nr:hypothetical protein [Deltaproteobacteria bacterium]
MAEQTCEFTLKNINRDRDEKRTLHWKAAGQQIKKAASKGLFECRYILSEHTEATTWLAEELARVGFTICKESSSLIIYWGVRK